MKQMARRICVAVLLVCMMAGMLMMSATAQAAATSTASGRRYNIMLVIDGSGSLISESTTDPEGMRYELIDDLLGVLEDDGHYVGAVVFSGNRGSDASDAAMESGIRCNTGMISLDPTVMTPNGSLPKDYIAQQIRQANVDQNKDGKTDVGTALLVAERELRKAQAQNGMESLIFLFTDGVTDVIHPEVKAKSEENLATATREIRENGIRLFGAFLNKGGKLANTQITEIVCSANGVSANSEEFLESYVELRDAASCHEAVNTLLKFLGYLDGPMPEPTTGSIEDEFLIPGIGVEEMNIRLYSYNGEDLPDLEVELIKPDGTVLSGTTLNSMCRSSRTIQVYKLVDPMSGLWKLRVTVPGGNKIAYVYSRVFSKHVDADLTLSPDVANLYVNTNTDFIATLSQNGATVTDPLAYTGYECRLMVQNLADGTVKTYPITGNGANFVHNMDLLEYSSFKAWVVFSCESFEVVSEPVQYDLFNNVPITYSPAYLYLKCGPMQDEETEVDVLAYADDPEDGKNVTVTLVNATCDTDAFVYDQASRKMILKNKLVGDAQFVFSVTDTQGAAAELRIEVQTTDVTIRYVLGVILVLLLLFVLFVLRMRKISKVKLDGNLTASFDVEYNDERKSVELLLPKPGEKHSSKTTLAALLKACLKDDTELHDGLSSEKIKEQLKDLWEELDKVQVSKSVTRVRNEKVGAILVKDGKKQTTMPGKRDVDIKTSVMDITVSYTREEQEEDLFDEDLDFGTPRNTKKDKKGSKKRQNQDVDEFEDF